MNNDLPRLGIDLACGCQAPHVRMHDGVEPFPRGRIVKDDLGERGPVQSPVAHDRRPTARDFVQGIAARRDRFARKFVRVDDVRAERFKAARDLALAGSDSAGQADSDGSPSCGAAGSVAGSTASSGIGSSSTSILSISSAGMSATC